MAAIDVAAICGVRDLDIALLEWLAMDGAAWFRASVIFDLLQLDTGVPGIMIKHLATGVPGLGHGVAGIIRECSLLGSSMSILFRL